MATASGAAGIYSDDFGGSEWVSNQPPNPATPVGWEFSVPTAGTLGISSGSVTITAPAEQNRTWYGGARTAPALRQSCTDNEFTVTIYTDLPASNGHEIGLYVSNSLDPGASGAGYSAGFYYDTALHLAAQDNQGGSEPYNSTSHGLTSPCALRLNWNGAGDDLACWASQDGTTWTSAYYTFSDLTSFVPAYVGVYVGTWGPETAHTRTVQYFYEAAGVIGAPTSRRIMVIT